MTTDAEIRAQLDDVSAFGATLAGEAASEPVEGRIALGGVIRNRLAHFTEHRATVGTYKAVCLAPAQFSCWSPEGGLANYARVMAIAEQLAHNLTLKDPVLNECLGIARALMDGWLLDRSRGAEWYLTVKLWNDDPPAWAKALQPVQTIGAHIFFKRR